MWKRRYVSLSLLIIFSLSFLTPIYFNSLFQIKKMSGEVNVELTEGNRISSNSLDSKTGYAIVVGIADYPGSGNDLAYADDDAQDVYTMLITDYNFNPANVILLKDAAATRDAINAAFDSIAAKIDSNDVLFFFYSGHGGSETSISQYSTNIATPHPYPNYYDNYRSISGGSNAIQMRVHFSRLETERNYDYVFVGDSDLQSGWYYYAYTGTYSSGLWSGWVPVLSDKRIWINLYSDYSVTAWGYQINYYEVEYYNNIQFLCPYDSLSYPSYNYFDYLLDSKLDSLNCAEKYIICDSCHSGGMISESQSSGRYMMMACLANEFSLEDPARQNGCFAYYFLNSLDYATDSNGDGVISIEECYDYCYPNTVTRSSSLGYTHHPQEYDGISGDAVLYPALGSVSFIPAGNQLNYTFDLYGNGAIQNISVVLASINATIAISQVEDISSIAPSETGFGHYNNSATLNGAFNLNNYGIVVQIQGNQLITLDACVTTDFDNDSIDDVIEIYYGLDPRSSDTDSDGLDDFSEFNGPSNPLNNDTDADGLLDGLEVFTYYTNVTNPDTDGDGLSDGLEILILLTNATNPDTDADGLLDGLEVFTYYTNVTNPDTDGDGLSDGLEILTLLINATNPDTDGDLMPDGYEYYNGLNLTVDDSGADLDGDGLSNLEEFLLNTPANNNDTDADGLLDGLEVFTYYTNVINPDTDGDGLSDGLEILILLTNATNPDTDGDLMPDGYEYNHDLNLFLDDSALDFDDDGLTNLLECQLGASANNTDSDMDSMSDTYEYNHDLNLILDDSALDFDGDGLTNLLECQLGVSANNTDSDNDGLNDYLEYYIYFTELLIADTDRDGLSDGSEVNIYHTEPLIWDTDGDGYSDGIEVAFGVDPLNPRHSLNTIILNIIGIVSLVVIAAQVTQKWVLKSKVKSEFGQKNSIQFKTKRESGFYNGLKVEKRVRPKPEPSYSYQPRTPSYQPRTPSYKTSSQNNISTQIRDLNEFVSNLRVALTSGQYKICLHCGSLNHISNTKCFRCERWLI